MPKGGTKTPTIVHPDGHDTAFSIPAGKTFVVTDVSIQRLSALGTAVLLEVSLTQDIPPGGATINRWSFVGETTANVERTFSTGVAFSTPFVVTNGSQSGDAVVVRLWGFFRIASGAKRSFVNLPTSAWGHQQKYVRGPT